MPHVGTITGSMTLDPSMYLTGMNQAAAATQSFQTSVNTIQFAGFNRGIFATTTLLYGLNRIMSSMSRGMEEYSNVLGRIGTVADLTAASVQALADSMKDVSTAYGVSRKDIMGGMYTAAQSRFTSPAEMRAMSKAGALLSHASGREINVKKATDLLAVTRQALGIGMGSVTSGRLTDILLRGRDVGRWELDQMAAALGIPITVFGNQYVGRQSGEETLRELLAIMSTATLAGLSPTRAATGTRRMIERTVQLNKSTQGEPLRKALRGAGFSPEDPIMDALNKGGINYLNTLIGLTGGSTSELNRLGFGSRDLMLLTSVMRGQGSQLRRSYMDLAYDSIGGTSEQYGEKMKGTYEYARQQLRSQWEITSQEFMKASMPLITEFTNVLSGFNRVAQALPDSVKSFAMLISGLASFRLALNFLGLRGPILRTLFMPGAAGEMAKGIVRGFGGVAGGAVAGGVGGDVAGMGGMAAMAAMGGIGGKGGKSVLAGGFPVGVKDITDYRKYINALVGGVSFKSVGELEKQALGIQTKGNYFRLRDERGRFTKLTSTDPNMPFIYENARRQKHGLTPIFRPPPTKSFLDSTGVKFKTLEELEKQALGIEKKGHYFRLRDDAGRFTKVTSRDSNMPFIYENARRQKYGLSPILRQPVAPFGSGFISAAAPMAGLYGGMALGERMGGDKGGMFLPMAMGIGGMGVASKLAGSYASGGMAGALGGLKVGALGAAKFAPHVMAAYIAYKIAKGSIKEATGRGPLSADEELAFLMRGQSKYALLRENARIGYNLERVIPQFARFAYDLTATPEGALKRRQELERTIGLSRVILSPSDIMTRYGLPQLSPSVREALGEKGLLDPASLFSDVGFKDFFKEHTTGELSEFLSSKESITSPVAWGDRLIDAMKGYADSLWKAKAETDRVTEETRRMGERQAVENATGYMKHAVARLAGYDTMFGLERSQLKPYQAGYGSKWSEAYKKGASGIIDKYMMGMEDRSFWEKVYKQDEELGVSDKDVKKSPFAGVKDLHKKLRQMRFLLTHGLDLGDTSKVTDEMITSAWGIDKKNLSATHLSRILGQIRGLDPGQWSQVFSPQQAPFSRAMYYGSQEAYNATLERKDDPFQVVPMLDKLQNINDTITATEENTEKKTEEFRKNLLDAIDGNTGMLSSFLQTAGDASGGFPDPGGVHN